MPEPFFQPNEYPLTSGVRLLEASAGTGKTFALAHLVLRLITEGDCSIEEILVVTFTDAAASELRSRISKRLEAALHGLEAIEHGYANEPPDNILKHWLEKKADTPLRRRWASLLLEALEGIERADITTIHGFCRRTLRREALESGQSLDPVLEVESKQLIYEVVHDYWENEILSLGVGHLRGLQAAGLNIDNLVNALLTVDGDPSMTLVEESDCFDSNASLVGQFGPLFDQCWANFLHFWRRDGIELEDELRARADFWRSLGSLNTKPFTPKPLKDRVEEVNRWVESIERKTESNTSPPYISVRDQKLLMKYFHPAIFCSVAFKCGDESLDLLKPELQKSIAELCDSPTERVWSHALRWGIRELSARRRQLGVISYGGLLSSLDPQHQTIDGADENLPWLSGVRKRYRAVLVDEFQDTDPVQWRLLKRAFANGSNHFLLMVGDPKQAIYRFRGGDLNTYLHVRREVKRIDVLVDNFRTSPDLMHGLNQFMSKGLTRTGLSVPSLNSCSERKALNVLTGQHPLKLLFIEQAGNCQFSQPDSLLSKTKIEELIPIAVANSVLSLLKTYSKQISLDDICILVSRHDQASSIRTGLERVGLPSQLVSRGDVLISEAALALQRFLDCIACPANSRSLRLLACSALVQWDLSRLEQSEVNGDLDRLALRFIHWKKNFTKLGLMGCVAELIEGRTMADLSGRGRFLGDLHQCGQLVQEAIHNEGLSVGRAAEWLRRNRLQPTDPIPKDRHPYSDVADSAINVLTVHRSKGLEYKVIICPYLWQSPPISNGPLWRGTDSSSWCIALNKSWGEGREVAYAAEQASSQEAERLAYVAMTRACSFLVLFWARSKQQEDNPLKCLLFGPEAVHSSSNELSTERMKKWLVDNDVPIDIASADTSLSNLRWLPIPPKGEIGLGASPNRKLDSNWGRYSYSSWISGPQNNLMSILDDPLETQEDRDTDQRDKTIDTLYEKDSLLEGWNLKLQKALTTRGPLDDFPRGPIAGDCLHRILEQIDFCKALDDIHSEFVIKTELQRAGLDGTFLSSVQGGLQRVLSTPLGGPLGDLKLNHLHDKRRIHELKFDLPLALEGGSLRSEDLSLVFKKDSWARFSGSYSEKLLELNFVSRGFFTGSIDLVFSDDDDPFHSRWWVLDWKSNWIGSRDSEGNPDSSCPAMYHEAALEKQMLLHHYPLQAHLYLVALHRFLQWRLPDYNPSRHLGGYIYVFLRGVPGGECFGEIPREKKIPGLFVEPTPFDRVMELNRLMRKGGR